MPKTVQTAYHVLFTIFIINIYTLNNIYFMSVWRKYETVAERPERPES